MAVAGVGLALVDRSDPERSGSCPPADSIPFDQATGWAAQKSRCENAPTQVDFDDRVTLEIPATSQDWVIGSFDGASEEDSVTAGVFRTDDDGLVTLLDGQLFGSGDAVRSARRAGFGAQGRRTTSPPDAELPDKAARLARVEARRAVESPRTAQVPSDGSPSSKCWANAGFAEQPPYLTGDRSNGYYLIQWRYNDANQPRLYPDAQYRARQVAAWDTWQLAQNSCRLGGPFPNIWVQYLGTSTASPGITKDADGRLGCSVPPPHSVTGWVGWGKDGILGGTCSWGGNTFSTVFNRAYHLYAAPSARGCHGAEFDLGDVAVHEFGHALGLLHVEGSRQVMYPGSDTCETFDRYLGRGDVKGVRDIYGRWAR